MGYSSYYRGGSLRFTVVSGITQKINGGVRVFSILSLLFLCSAFIPFFNKYVLNSYCVSRSVLFTGDVAVRKQDKSLWSQGAYILVREVAKNMKNK